MKFYFGKETGLFFAQFHKGLLRSRVLSTRVRRKRATPAQILYNSSVEKRAPMLCTRLHPPQDEEEEKWGVCKRILDAGAVPYSAFGRAGTSSKKAFWRSAALRVCVS